MVIDKIPPNRTNRIMLGCPMVILLVHGSLDGWTLPLHGIGWCFPLRSGLNLAGMMFSYPTSAANKQLWRRSVARQPYPRVARSFSPSGTRWPASRVAELRWSPWALVLVENGTSECQERLSYSVLKLQPNGP